jgi:hypothetical protein
MAFEISCIVEDANKVITHIGVGANRWDVPGVVDDIRNNRYQYYTYKDRKKADVYAKQHPKTGRWFLTTDPDDTRENNLDFLPKCT